MLFLVCCGFIFFPHPLFDLSVIYFGQDRDFVFFLIATQVPPHLWNPSYHREAQTPSKACLEEKDLLPPLGDTAVLLQTQTHPKAVSPLWDTKATQSTLPAELVPRPLSLEQQQSHTEGAAGFPCLFLHIYVTGSLYSNALDWCHPQDGPLVCESPAVCMEEDWSVLLSVNLKFKVRGR